MQKVELYGRISSMITKVFLGSSFLVFSFSVFILSINHSIAKTEGEFPTIKNMNDLTNLRTQEHGKYTVAMTSAAVNGRITTAFTVMNTQTGASKIYQLFHDKYGGGWKVIELSDSKTNLKLPQATF